MILTFWTDSGPGWRSRWISCGASGPANHVTLQVGEYSLHADPRRQGWYRSDMLHKAYKSVYYPLASYKFKDRGRRYPTATMKYPSLKVLWWKYLNGPKPLVCTGMVCNALTYNGEAVPIYVDPNDLMRHFNDRNWPKWQGPYG